MQRKTLRMLSVLLAVVALAGGYSASRLLQQRETVQPSTLGGDFTLQSSSGPVSLSDFRGQVVPIYFGYTFCPDACPTSLTYLSMAIKRLTEQERRQIQPLFVSIDPERDTPQRLAEYVAHFDTDMLGLTGTVDEVTAVASQYGVYFKPQKADDRDEFYLVDHTSRTYVMARDGELVV
ncbi:MAG: SCO family protein, partial [Gammaproteobacteria bacterium]|nr:SCO family protein [Gammaproteobacteria bacterium]